MTRAEDQCTAAPDDCSLRGAITNANFSAETDTIDLANITTYTLTVGRANEDQNVSPTPSPPASPTATPTGQQRVWGDVNCDYLVAAGDAKGILAYIAGVGRDKSGGRHLPSGRRSGVGEWHGQDLGRQQLQRLRRSCRWTVRPDLRRAPHAVSGRPLPARRRHGDHRPAVTRDLEGPVAYPQLQGWGVVQTPGLTI